MLGAQDLDNETQRVFLLLKPLCVSLLDAATWSSPKQAIATLQNLIDVINRASDVDGVILDRLFGYVSWPLLSGLEFENVKDLVREQNLRALRLLLKRSNKSVTFKTYLSVLQTIPFLLSFGYVPKTKDAKPLLRNPCESVLRESLLLWQEAMVDASDSITVFHGHWTLLAETEQHEPLVAHLIYTLLELLKDTETNVGLQVLLISLLRSIVSFVLCNAKLLKRVLPGLFSGLARVLHEDKERRPRNSRVLAPALHLWQLLASRALDGLSMESNLVKLLPVLGWLNQHHSVAVRETFVRLHAVFVSHMGVRAPKPSLDVVLAALSESQTFDANFLRDLASLLAGESIFVYVQQRLLEHLSRLPGTLVRQNASPWQRHFALKSIIGGFEVLLQPLENPPASIVSSLTTLMQGVRLGLLNALQPKPTNTSLVQEQNPRTAFEAGKLKGVDQWYKYFPQRSFLHFDDEQTEALTRRAMGLLSRYWYETSHSFSLYEFFIEILSTDSQMMPASIFILNSMVSLGFSREPEFVDILCLDDSPSKSTHFVEDTLLSWLQIYSHCLASTSERLASGTSSGSEKQWLCESLSLLLEGIAVLLGLLEKSTAEVQLIDVGLPLLACWLSSNRLVSHSASAAVSCYASHIGYTSASAMVTANVDYIVNAIQLGLLDAETTFNSLKALEAAMQIAGDAIVDRLESCLVSCANLVYKNWARRTDGSTELLLAALKVTLSFFRLLTARDAAKSEAPAARDSSPGESVQGDSLLASFHGVGPELLKFALEYKVSLDSHNANFKLEPLLQAVKLEDNVEVGSELGVNDGVIDGGCNEAKVPLLVDLAAFLLEKIVLLLDHEDLQVRVTVLQNMKYAFPLIDGTEGVLLPLIHDTWNALISKLLDVEHSVVLEALDTIKVVCNVGKSFSAKKVIGQVLPNLERVLKYCAEAESLSLKNAKPVQRVSRLLPSLAGNSTLGDSVDWLGRKSVVLPSVDSVQLLDTSATRSLAMAKSSRKTYYTSYLYRLQVAAINLVKELFTCLKDLSHAELERLLLLVIPRFNSRIYVPEITSLATRAVLQALRYDAGFSATAGDIVWYWLSLIDGQLNLNSAPLRSSCAKLLNSELPSEDFRESADAVRRAIFD